MDFTDLERAVELRKRAAHAAAMKASHVASVSVNGSSGGGGGNGCHSSTTASSTTTPSTPDPSRKRFRDESVDESDDAVCHQIEAESSYLLLSHTRQSSHSHDGPNQRTGRWTIEEVAYVDLLVSAFDKGSLPVPHGVKLNEFLGDILLCKSSRLTKKMKNAKLSTRSYSIKNSVVVEGGARTHDCSLLSTLQQQFFTSISSEPLQLEMKFNTTKQWRQHFSNLCLQIGYEMLDARDWLQSLEEMEARASEAEEAIRKARRRRMGLALKRDAGNAKPGVFIGTMQSGNASVQPLQVPSSIATASASAAAAPPAPPTTGGGTLMERDISATRKSVIESLQREPSRVSDSNDCSKEQMEEDDMYFLADVLGIGSNMDSSGPTTVSNGSSQLVGGPRGRTFSEDFALALPELEKTVSTVPQLNGLPSELGDCGPFLEQIVRYMESEKLPFEYVDIWVPSFLQSRQDSKEDCNSSTSLRLFYAGHATRSDSYAVNKVNFCDFGEYSTNFSFAPGVGLPGRVYHSGKPSWEVTLHRSDPFIFERAGGAKMYNVRTALGIPMTTASVGRVVLAMYSSRDLSEDPKLTERCVAEISKWSPEPKWKLVIELGSSSDTQKTAQMDSSRVPKQEASPTPTGSNGKIVTRRIQATAQSSSALEIQKHQPDVRSSQSQALGKVPSSSDDEEDNEERRIATLLGDHMPVAASTLSLPAPSPSGSLLPHLISLRLLLLKTPERRTEEEVENLEIMKKSFRGYSKDNKRSGAELATLLAKDWIILSASKSLTSSQLGATAHSTQPHQCHVLKPTNLPSASAGGPTRMPAPPVILSNLQPPTPATNGVTAPLVTHHHQVSFSSVSSLATSAAQSSSSSSLNNGMPISITSATKTNPPNTMRPDELNVAGAAAVAAAAAAAAAAADSGRLRLSQETGENPQAAVAPEG